MIASLTILEKYKHRQQQWMKIALVLILLFHLYKIFLLYLKSNKNAMSVTKRRTFKQMVVTTVQCNC